MGLMAWAAVTGALVGMVRGIRRRLGGGGKKEDAPSAALRTTRERLPRALVDSTDYFYEYSTLITLKASGPFHTKNVHRSVERRRDQVLKPIYG